jgi:hypothetical protein
MRAAKQHQQCVDNDPLAIVRKPLAIGAVYPFAFLFPLSVPKHFAVFIQNPLEVPQIFAVAPLVCSQYFYKVV